MPDLVKALAARAPSIGALTREVSSADQVSRGYGHTLQEICRQPKSWQAIASQLSDCVLPGLESSGGLILTGSGSSHFIGVALAPTLQVNLKRPVRAVSAGEILLSPEAYVNVERCPTIVSFGRSGDSPESIAVADLIFKRWPQCQQIFVTCNPNGRLATAYESAPQIQTIVLGSDVNDQSLVMTSSFTSLWLAGRALGVRDGDSAVPAIASSLAEMGQGLLLEYSERLAELACRSFDRAAFLGSGPRFGAALEAELKMLEMCGGRVTTCAESYLGLRHGPMAGLTNRTLLVAFISTNNRRRAYELDLLNEVQQKELGLCVVYCGSNLPNEIKDSDGRLCVEYGVSSLLGDDDLVALDVLVGQLLGFFRCLHERLKPDAPSETGVIDRVVPSFPTYSP
tara:strand:+ start:66 stop:1259 length:1194 start_codon:yes stop_codon:yes gene_type:complete